MESHLSVYFFNIAVHTVAQISYCRELREYSGDRTESRSSGSGHPREPRSRNPLACGRTGWGSRSYRVAQPELVSGSPDAQWRFAFSQDSAGGGSLLSGLRSRHRRLLPDISQEATPPFKVSGCAAGTRCGERGQQVGAGVHTQPH